LREQAKAIRIISWTAVRETAVLWFLCMCYWSRSEQ